MFGLSYAGEVGGGRGPSGEAHDDANANQTVVVTGPGGSAWTPDEGNTWFTLPGVGRMLGSSVRQPESGLVGWNRRTNPED